MVVLVMGIHFEDGWPTHTATTKAVAVAWLQANGWRMDDTDGEVTDTHWLNDDQWATIEEKIQHIA